MSFRTALPLLRRFCANNFSFIVLLIVGIVIAGVNARFGQRLLGWDSLHIEFDFTRNFSSIVHGAWRQDQGLGAVAAHSHSSELPRAIFLWLFSWIVPNYSLRYFYIALCLILGPLGIAAFVRKIVSSQQAENTTTRELAALVAGTVYLCNLGTLQHFYVVFEMFAVQYAALGWLFYIVYNIFHSHGGELKKQYLLFVIISFLATPMAYASTLWMAYFFALACYVFFILIQEITSKEVWKKSIIVVMLTLLVNLFWFAPSLYLIFSDASAIPSQSKINNGFSEEAFLRNQSFGSWLDLALLRNFLFDWQIYDFENSEFVELLPQWHTHIAKWGWVGVVQSILALLGLGAVFFTKHYRKWQLGIIAFIAFTVFMLINANPPFTNIFLFLRDNISIFKEGFRFPFTKFSIIYMFGVASLVGIFTHSLFTYIKNSIVTKLIAATLFCLSLLYTLPFITGNLVGDLVFNQLPQAYTQLFTHMEDEPSDRRLALLPIPSHVGWEYYQWGFQGAGFVWFGLDQPVLTRDFDRWHPGNESFYQELSTTLYSCPVVSSNEFLSLSNSQRDRMLHECAEDFQKILTKYDVSYVLVDESMFAPGRLSDYMRIEEISSLLEILGWEKAFAEDIVDQETGLQNYGELALWQAPSSYISSDNFIFTPSSYTIVDADTNKVKQDSVYTEVGDYVSVNQLQDTAQSDDYVSFPFAHVYREEIDNVQVDPLEEGSAAITFTAPVSAGTIQLPALVIEETPLEVSLEYSANNKIEVFVSPAITTSESTLETLGRLDIVLDESQQGQAQQLLVDELLVELELGESKQIQLAPSNQQQVAIALLGQASTISVADQLVGLEAFNCQTPQLPSAAVGQVIEDNKITLTATDASACISYSIGELDPDNVIVITQAYESATETTPRLCFNQAGIEPYTCLHNAIETLLIDNQAKRFQVASYITNSGQYWLDITARANRGEGESSITYAVPDITQYTVVQNSIIPLGTSGMKISLDEVNDTFSITLISRPIARLPLRTGAAENCDIFDRGEITSSYDQDSLIASADNKGIHCQQFTLPTVSNTNDYLLHVVGDNVAGRSSKMYVSNWTSQRNDLEFVFDERSFDHSFVLLSSPYQEGEGYSVNVETRSFGQYTENKIDQISLHQIPLHWLASIKHFPASKSDDISDYIQDNTINIISTKKFGTSHYQVVSKEGGLLALSQGFDNGWVAYQMPVDACQFSNICLFIPWFRGSNLEHVMVNGWANGFFIEDLEDDNQENLVVIIFWPQYLQWGGYALLILTSMYLLFYRPRKEIM